jgi:hypothetical protein
LSARTFKPLIPFAALRLQRTRVMSLGLRVVLVTLVAFPTLARAQTSSGTMPVGGCTGTVTADIAFAAKQNGQSGLQSISTSYAPNVYGRAECDCNPSEMSGDAIYMRLQISNGLMQGAVTNVSAWVGAGCDNYQTRINTSAVSCKQFTPANLTPSSFNAGSGNIGPSTFYDLYVPARALFSPAAGSCDTDATNSIWIFIGQNLMMPDATCQVNISERSTGASPPVNPGATSGDGAVNVVWQGPTTVNTSDLRSPVYYQILCADMSGNPLSGTPADPWYSTCLADGTIRRRQNIFGGTNISGTDDGGSTAADLSLGTMSLGSSSQALGQGAPSPADVDLGGVDFAGVDLFGVDFSTPPDLSSNPNDESAHPTHFDNIGPFSNLDPRFICSDFIDATTTTDFTKRIDGLTNNNTYQFVIVSIDAYGNATPSTLVMGTPKPVDDLYTRYRDAGGTAQGFCFVATAAFGDYDHPQVRVLRAFRDRVLQESAFGRALIRFYYATSPPLARFIAVSVFRRWIARVVLWPLVGLALLALQTGSLLLALLLAGGLPALALWLRRRARHRRARLEIAA